MLSSDGKNAVKIEHDGSFIGLDDGSREIIKKFDLNTPHEIQLRINDSILHKLMMQYSKALRQPIVVFSRAMNSVAIINRIPLTKFTKSNDLIRTMLYANIITALESFLSDYLITAVDNFDGCLKNLGGNYEGFKDTKYSLRELIKADKSPRDLALNKLHGIVFHNMYIVSQLYSSAFNIEFGTPNCLSNAIENRHDIIHRNGYKVGAENPEQYSKEQVFDLIIESQNFIIQILTAIKEKNTSLCI